MARRWGCRKWLRELPARLLIRLTRDGWLEWAAEGRRVLVRIRLIRGAGHGRSLVRVDWWRRLVRAARRRWTVEGTAGYRRVLVWTAGRR